MIRRPPISPLFPPTPLSRSRFAVDPNRHGYATLEAANLARISTRAIGAADQLCHNEEILYPPLAANLDRKSTRLNSSHGYISYAVFCLKKKKNKRQIPHSST